MNKEYERSATPAERIKLALNIRNMKAVELSERSGINKASISCYLSGKYEPKQEALYKMGKALDVAEMWLAGYDVPIEKPAWQKENDELADLVDHLQKNKDFRQLIISISQLKSEQIELIRNLVQQLIS